MNNVIPPARVHVHFDVDILKRFRMLSLIVGGLLIVAGIAGMAVPQFISALASVFLGWLLVTAGILSAYLAFLSHWRSMIAWLKPVLLILIGALFLFYPVSGVLTLALLLTVYLMLDAYGSLGLAYELYPLRGWGWMTFNGICSLLLAALLIFAWPAGSAVLLGLYIGISLFFDGLALLFLGLSSRIKAVS